MTSPPPNLLASAKHSSRAEQASVSRTDEAAEVLAQFPLHPRQTGSTAEDTPVSSAPVSSPVSLGYHNIYNAAYETSPAPSRPLESSSRPPKRTASLTKSRWHKSRRSSQGTHQPSDATGVLDETALPHRGQGSRRAPAPLSAILGDTIQAREPPLQSARRHPGRPPKYPPLDNETESPLNPGRNEDGDLVTSPSSASTQASVAPRPSPHQQFNPSSSYGLWYPMQRGIALPGFKPADSAPRIVSQLAANPPTLLHPQITGRSPRMPLPPNVGNAPRLTMAPSTGLQTHIKQEASSDASLAMDPHRRILPSPFGATETQRHESFPRPVPTVPIQPSDSAAIDGFKVVRNAVPLGLVRNLNSVVANGLPVVEGSATHEAYSTPLQAYMLRDAFNSNCRNALREFYAPIKQIVPPMPRSTVVGHFLPGDSKDGLYSLLNVGYRHQLYVHIALNGLSTESGFFDILQGSHTGKHPTRTPVDEWLRASFNLNEGDAIIWRGDLTYLLSSKGGGRWMCLTYDWGIPARIDLTRE